MNAAPSVELWQFNFSMFPEKARWALDYKGIAYHLHTLLPGPHAPALMLRFGQSHVPILRHGHVLKKQSADVLAYLEEAFPETPSLLPADAAHRACALEMQQWFDAAGEHVRRAGFFELLPHAGYMADIWSEGRSALSRALYRTLFPLAVRPLMRATMDIGPATADVARARTAEALDRVADASQATGYLVGDAFSLADLTAATVLQLAVPCAECPVPLARPWPPGADRWVGRWASHPGAEYVRRMYRQHRLRRPAINARSA